MYKTLCCIEQNFILQIGQLGEAAQKYQAAAQNTTSSIPTQELQSNCNT